MGTEGENKEVGENLGSFQGEHPDTHRQYLITKNRQHRSQIFGHKTRILAVYSNHSAKRSIAQ